MGKPFRVTPNGQRVDYVWMDDATKDEPQALEIQRNMWVVRPKFGLYGAGHVLANLFVAGVLPLATVIAVNEGWVGLHGAVNVLLVMGVFKVIDLFVEPGLQVLRYSFGVQKNQEARTRYVAGDKKGAQQCLDEAIDATTPKPPALAIRLAIGLFFNRQRYQ
jgi:hypothetical protein